MTGFFRNLCALLCTLFWSFQPAGAESLRAAGAADGETVIKDAAELRVKEVDRIAVMVAELRKLGAEVEEHPDGMIVQGGVPLRGATVDSHGDHRMGMALAIAGLFAGGETLVQDADCIADSFPGFAETMTSIGAEMRTA